MKNISERADIVNNITERADIVNRKITEKADIVKIPMDLSS